MRVQARWRAVRCAMLRSGRVAPGFATNAMAQPRRAEFPSMARAAGALRRTRWQQCRALVRGRSPALDRARMQSARDAPLRCAKPRRHGRCVRSPPPRSATCARGRVSGRRRLAGRPQEARRSACPNAPRLHCSGDGFCASSPNGPLTRLHYSAGYGGCKARSGLDLRFRPAAPNMRRAARRHHPTHGLPGRGEPVSPGEGEQSCRARRKS